MAGLPCSVDTPFVNVFRGGYFVTHGLATDIGPNHSPWEGG